MTQRTIYSETWTLAQRGRKNAVLPGQAVGSSVEIERQRDGILDSVLTLFTANRECSYKCLMCDLWRNTLDHRSPTGSVASQVDDALAAHPDITRLKLYTAGSFFDQGAVPTADVERIVQATRNLKTVIVESHPRLITEDALQTLETFGNHRVEVAMGLETVHPQVLQRLNKRMTVDDFARATQRLSDVGIAARAFILLRPPFMTEDEGYDWALRSVETAWDMGVECCVLIPVRGGNGALDRLAAQGLFEPPRLHTLERALSACLSKARGRVFADLWDAPYFGADDPDTATRIERIARMNQAQRAASSAQ